MPELKILNSKEIKEIMQLIESQWGAKIKMEYGFLKNAKNRVFIINKDISKIDTSMIRINSAGMYFCEIDKKGIRLGIEGTQIIGPKAEKNVVLLDEDEARKWLRGEDLEKECKECSGFVILKYNPNKNFPGGGNFSSDFLGCGKYTNAKILNYVGKPRRIQMVPS